MKQLLLLTLLMCTWSLYAQEPVADCEGGTQGAYMHGNDIRAYINNSGGLFFDGNDASFEVPFGNDVHSIFAQGLWIGGTDPGGNLKVAAQTYGYPNVTDYFPGPLTDEGTTEADDCRNWDKVWCVLRYQIEAHQADYADNNVIDNPIDEIFAWPAIGNPQFEEQNGFVLPNSTSGLAPFVDTDQNGVYNPLKGDYPMIDQSVNVPEQICWNVYNDAGGIHSSSQGDLLHMEVQLTSWAFSCTDNEQLNKTLFTSYKFINKGIESLDSVHVGLWHDFDLGCYTDDYIGYHEASNSVFAYNQDNIDGENGGSCPGGINSYGENPPVQSATFLNRSLDYGMYYNNAGIGGAPGVIDPNVSLEYYYYLTGRWRDGSPLEHGGDGYQEGTFPTNIAFPGDPNDPNEWSALSVNISAGDRRTISSTLMEQLMEPGMVQTLDVAYSFFREEGNNYLENVTAMYAGLEDLQAWYDAAFEGVCLISQTCEEDCVWPGDLNADGIANYCDLIPLGAALNENGASRPGPYNWSPHTGTNWTATQLNGANAKHLDANGDAVADANDFALTQQHYGFTVPAYDAEVIVVPSSEQGLYIEPSQGPLEDLVAGQTAFAKIGIEGYEPLRALAFSLQYDTRYFSNIQVFANGFDESAIQYAADHPELGGLHYAHYVLEGNELITDGAFLNIVFHVNDDLDMEELPSDALVLQFANTKGINELGEDVVVESQNLTATFEGVTISSTEDLAEDINVEIFPNPTRNNITVKCILPMMGNIELHSASGQHLHTYAAKGAKQQTISLNDLPTGLYFLQIPTEEGLIVEKIIKK